jgi:hypothetical protein
MHSFGAKDLRGGTEGRFQEDPLQDWQRMKKRSLESRIRDGLSKGVRGHKGDAARKISGRSYLA